MSEPSPSSHAFRSAGSAAFSRLSGKLSLLLDVEAKTKKKKRAPKTMAGSKRKADGTAPTSGKKRRRRFSGVGSSQSQTAASSGTGSRSKSKVKKPKGTLQLQMSVSRQFNLARNRRKMPLRNDRFAAIDMSLTSPGVCLVDCRRRHIHLLGYTTLKGDLRNCVLPVDDVKSFFYGWIVEVTLLEDPVEPAAQHSLFRFNRFERRTRTLLQLIGTEPLAVLIEDYSRQSRGFTRSGRAVTPESAQTLPELGGVLRLMLGQYGHRIAEVPPSSHKKLFSGKGSASKCVMYHAYRTFWRLPNLFAGLNRRKGEERIMALSGEQRTKSKASFSPIDDMVDALSLGIFGFDRLPLNT